MLFRKTPFEKALAAGLRTGKLWEALNKLGEYRLKTRDVAVIRRALNRLSEGRPSKARLATLGMLCNSMRSHANVRVYVAVYQQLLPLVIDLFDAWRDCKRSDKADLVKALETLACYQHPRAIKLILEAGQSSLAEVESYRWYAVFRESVAVNDPDSLHIRLFDALAGYLPSGSMARALLGFANEMMLGQVGDAKLDRHPFDNPAGCELLESWLRRSDEESARQCAVALAFLEPRACERLFHLAMEHPDRDVQMEAAWASARCGSKAGLKVLVRFCCDVHSSATACRYLEEIGKADAIPAQARDPDFRAMAIMSAWLQHPSELGEIPEELVQVDSRELFWPPTQDRRRLWLFSFTHKYTPYEPDGNGAEKAEPAFGLVGGVNTWSFFSVVEPDWPIDDIYALHCSWESQLDQTNPGRQSVWPYSVEHGHKLLTRHNGQF